MAKGNQFDLQENTANCKPPVLSNKEGIKIVASKYQTTQNIVSMQNSNFEYTYHGPAKNNYTSVEQEHNFL